MDQPFCPLYNIEGLSSHQRLKYTSIINREQTSNCVLYREDIVSNPTCVTVYYVLYLIHTYRASFNFLLFGVSFIRGSNSLIILQVPGLFADN